VTEMSSPSASSSRRLFDWLDARLGLRKIWTTVFARTVPKTNWFYTLGSASTILAMLQGVTGMLLTIYYVPAPDHAYDSIQYIMNEVTFGWLIRGLHHWGATLMVVVVFLHMLRTYLVGGVQVSQGSDLVDGWRSASGGARTWIQRLSSALEPAGVLG